MAITTFMYTLLLISDGCITCHQAEPDDMLHYNMKTAEWNW
jgi:chromatin segregation and condensation protein Rec8/ScpA/Scc1 (kleisin family)